MGISVELELNEDGYRRLSQITDTLAKVNPDVTLGAIVAAVIEIGTEVAEQRIKNGLSMFKQHG